MFGKKDEKGAGKSNFWPWGKKDEPAAPQPAADVRPDTEKTVEPTVTPPGDAQSAVAESVAQPEPATESQPGMSAETAASAVVPEPVRTVTPQVEPATAQAQKSVQITTPAAESAPEPSPLSAPESTDGGFFSRMKKGLKKTRASLVEGVATLFIGKKEIDDELMEDLETELIMADVGVDATRDIIAGLTERVKYKELDDADALMEALKTELAKILEPADNPLVIDQARKPYVILVVGVNGVGKTTTIGKLAKRLQTGGHKVMLAAGDTFRAAAVEQLQVWGERNQIPVIGQHTGADSASVIYDAFEAAKARDADVLIADTAGRLHNKQHLMEELKKVKRVLGRLDDTAPHEVLLVMDAGTGQNALSQARLFNETVQVTGMALTKLDGTAKGGVIFALARQMRLPIRFLGVGEQIDDLRPFHAAEFVDALFADTEF